MQKIKTLARSGERRPARTAVGRAAGRGVPRGTGGFTLIELMVALTLLSLILGGVVGVLFNIQTSWTTSQNQIKANQSERASIELMANDIRMAGSGFGGLLVSTSGVVGGFVHSLEPRPGHSAPDTLYVTGCLTGATTATTNRVGAPSDDIVVADVAQFAVNDLVIISSNSNANMFQVTGINAATRTLTHANSSPYNVSVGHVWPNGGYDVSSRVAKISRVAYWLQEDVDTGERTLMRKDGTAEPLAVAMNVNWMRLRYVNSDGSVSSNPADPGLVKSVLLDYVSPIAGMAAGGDDGDTLSMRIQPRVLS